jgi:hypothetical protein
LGLRPRPTAPSLGPADCTNHDDASRARPRLSRICALRCRAGEAALQQRRSPSRLKEIFRDEDEVPASADLNDQIKQAPLASRFLIVVCSPYTPRSKWLEAAEMIVWGLPLGSRCSAADDGIEGSRSRRVPSYLPRDVNLNVSFFSCMRIVAHDARSIWGASPATSTVKS